MQYKVVSSPAIYPEAIVNERSPEKTKVLDTHVNLAWLLSHFNASIRFNLMTHKREISILNQYVFNEDAENDILGRIEYICIVNGMPVKNTDKWLSIIAGENPYHPIVECMKDNLWDGIPILDRFVSTIKSTRPVIDKVLLKTWMTASVAAAHCDTGFTNHGVLVLQGDQGIGKTAWVKRLDPINCGAVRDNYLLDPRNKDNVAQSNEYWILELGELDATFNKTDIARLKSFITSPSDCIRFPYARRNTTILRRSSYIATVNESNFLIDTTGNRRWWTISVDSIDYNHDFDMKQVWAEVYHNWINGALTYLPSDIQKMVNENNETYEKIDPLKEKILTHYDWENPYRNELTSTQVLEEMGYSRPTRAEATRVGTILCEINHAKPRRSHKGNVHLVPARRFHP